MGVKVAFIRFFQIQRRNHGGSSEASKLCTTLLARVWQGDTLSLVLSKIIRKPQKNYVRHVYSVCAQVCMLVFIRIH